MTNRRYRPRKQFKFWLYRDLAEDVRLMEYADYLLKTRQFATVVRNGLRLMWSLSQGDLSVLFELFPTLRAQLQPDSSELIAQFREMLLANSTATAPRQQQPSGTQRALPMPDDDEDTIIIRTDATASEDAMNNFFKAAFGMAGVKQPVIESSAPPRQQLVLDDDDYFVPDLAPSAVKLQPMH